MQRKSSLAAMFETMGSAELIRMDADEVCWKTWVLKERVEVPMNNTSAMAIDLGFDLSAKKVGVTKKLVRNSRRVAWDRDAPHWDPYPSSPPCRKVGGMNMPQHACEAS